MLRAMAERQLVASVLCHCTVPGVRIPPSPLQKAKNGMLRPGPRGRVFAYFERVRGQVGGKLVSNKRTRTDPNTLKMKTLIPNCIIVTPVTRRKMAVTDER